LFLLLDSSTSLPLCVDSSMSYLFPSFSVVLFTWFFIIDVYFFFLFDGVGAPFTLNNTTLKFCPYNGSTFCNSIQDAQIQKQFQQMNVSDTACSSLLKSILCAVSKVLFIPKCLFYVNL
jgi:hypothetical protein